MVKKTSSIKERKIEVKLQYRHKENIEAYNGIRIKT